MYTKFFLKKKTETGKKTPADKHNQTRDLEGDWMTICCLPFARPAKSANNSCTRSKEFCIACNSIITWPINSAASDLDSRSSSDVFLAFLREAVAISSSPSSSSSLTDLRFAAVVAVDDEAATSLERRPLAFGGSSAAVTAALPFRPETHNKLFNIS